MKRPQWVRAKVRIYLATCWMGYPKTDVLIICGINWFNQKLLWLCMWFHDWFVQPFFQEIKRYPMEILEIYQETANGVSNEGK